MIKKLFLIMNHSNSKGIFHYQIILIKINKLQISKSKKKVNFLKLKIKIIYKYLNKLIRKLILLSKSRNNNLQVFSPILLSPNFNKLIKNQIVIKNKLIFLVAQIITKTSILFLVLLIITLKQLNLISSIILILYKITLITKIVFNQIIVYSL
jgi:hypothetical protein